MYSSTRLSVCRVTTFLNKNHVPMAEPSPADSAHRTVRVDDLGPIPTVSSHSIFESLNGHNVVESIVRSEYPRYSTPTSSQTTAGNGGSGGANGIPSVLATRYHPINPETMTLQRAVPCFAHASGLLEPRPLRIIDFRCAGSIFFDFSP